MRKTLFNTGALAKVAVPAGAGLFAAGYSMRRDYRNHEEYETSMTQQGFVKEHRESQNKNPSMVTALGGGYRHEDSASMWVKKSASETVQVPYDTSYVKLKP